MTFSKLFLFILFFSFHLVFGIDFFIIRFLIWIASFSIQKKTHKIKKQNKKNISGLVLMCVDKEKEGAKDKESKDSDKDKEKENEKVAEKEKESEKPASDENKSNDSSSTNVPAAGQNESNKMDTSEKPNEMATENGTALNGNDKDSDEKRRLFNEADLQRAASAALASAAVKAKHMSALEERKIKSLVALLVETQMKKLVSTRRFFHLH